MPETVTRQRRGCDLNPGPSAPESSTLTTRLPSIKRMLKQHLVSYRIVSWGRIYVLYACRRFGQKCANSFNAGSHVRRDIRIHHPQLLARACQKFLVSRQPCVINYSRTLGQIMPVIPAYDHSHLRTRLLTGGMFTKQVIIQAEKPPNAPFILKIQFPPLQVRFCEWQRFLLTECHSGPAI